MHPKNSGKIADIRSVKLVIVEDEEAHFQLMKRAIARSIPNVSIFHFPDPELCFKELDNIDPCMIIVDYLMPGMDGIEFLRILNRDSKQVPVIMITGQGDENIAVQAMKLGAWDYLVKSVDCFTLLPSIIQKVAREKELRDSLRESARLNDLLLNSLPNPAMLIRRDRVILAANRIAEEVGAKKGGYCWSDFGHCEYMPEKDKQYFKEHGKAPPGGTKCTFCLADEAFENNRATNDPEVKAFGRLWDTWWVPIDQDVCLHYAIDITARKRAEEQIHDLTRQLMKAQETERQKLSCDLHDVIGQDLSTLKIGLDTLVNHETEAFPGMHGKVAGLSKMLQDIIISVRTMAYDLRPAALDEIGLVPTFHQYCEEFSTACGLQVDFHSAGMENLHLGFDTRIALYRLIQEGLNNIRKHAGATIAAVRLVASFPNIVLLIEDNGKGFDVQSHLSSAGNEKGIGLRSMKERAGQLHGSMRINSRPLQGTKIRIEVPIEEKSGGP